MNTQTTILYVEDNPENRLLIRRILQAEGYRVVEAPTAYEAIDYVQKEVPDLILMDINLPEIDGYTLTAQFRTQPNLKNTPIIALTANVMRGDRERTLEAGCDGYIQKPVDVDTLPILVEGFMREVKHG